MAPVFELFRPAKRWTPARYRALVRHGGRRSVMFRTRLAIIVGAVAIGIVANAASRWICREKLYHALSATFTPTTPERSGWW